jgi:SanA protein
LKKSDRAATRTPFRRTLLWVILIGGMTIATLGAIAWDVHHNLPPIYRLASEAPPEPVAIVFGAGYSQNVLSAILEDRVKTGIDLYKEGKVKKLLMTGDNGHHGYSEPDAMKAYAMRAGVPSKDIVCDYAGFRTYDSLYRARDIFGVHRAILVSQAYHLPRALYTAKGLGMDVVGVSATRRPYIGQEWFDKRELISVEVAWLDINVLHPRPKYLGARVNMFGG